MGLIMIDIKIYIHQMSKKCHYSDNHLGVTAEAVWKMGRPQYAHLVSNKPHLSRCYLLRIGVLSTKPQLLAIWI